MAYYFKNELHTVQVTALENSIRGLQLMRDVWSNRDETNAKTPYDYLKKFNHLDLLWDLVENENNKLVVDILGLALEDEVPELFSCSDALKKIHFTLNLIEDENNDIEGKLVDQLIKHSEIEKELKNSSNLDVPNYSKELLLILEKINDKEIINGIASTLVGLEKEEWDTCFAKDTYLVDVALEIKNKNTNFSLENTYLYSIFEFAEQWANGEIKVTNWQKYHWNNLVNLMGISFQKRYRNQITKLLLEKEFVVTNEFYENNCNFFEYNTLLKDGRSKIQDSLAEAVKDGGKFDHLQMLDMILMNDNNGDFLPEDYISEVVSKPLNELYWAEEDMGNKEILKRLSKKFNVEIKEQSFESKEDAVQ